MSGGSIPTGGECGSCERPYSPECPWCHGVYGPNPDNPVTLDVLFAAREAAWANVPSCPKHYPKSCECDR